jgi:hypothetical protein
VEHKSTRIALALNAFCCPIAVGLWALANGLMADALHLLTDATAYARGLMAIPAFTVCRSRTQKILRKLVYGESCDSHPLLYHSCLARRPIALHDLFIGVRTSHPGGRSNSPGYGHFKLPHLTTVD